MKRKGVNLNKYFKNKTNYFLYMQKKHRSGFLSEEEWKVIDKQWDDFSYRWNQIPVEDSKMDLKIEDDIESIDQFDPNIQSILKFMKPKKKNLPDKSNKKDITVYDDDKKQAKEISKSRKEQELNLKYPNGYYNKYSKLRWLQDYKLPKATGRIISTRHDDIHRSDTACYFRRNHKFKIALLVYFKSLIEDRNEILDILDREVGIYLLINNVNNKIYIGSSSNLPQRMKYYMSLSIKNSFKTDNERPIVKAINKYGLENFSLGILLMDSQYVWFQKDNWKKVLLDWEQEFINCYHPEYNDIKALKIPLED
jgi:GIY-YIG catalytic domain